MPHSLIAREDCCRTLVKADSNMELLFKGKNLEGKGRVTRHIFPGVLLLFFFANTVCSEGPMKFFLIFFSVICYLYFC